MIYCKEISIPANTRAAAPYKAQVDVVEGIVKRVWVRWRWGSADLAGCAIFRAGFQVWPTTGDEWFPSSIHETVFDELYKIGDEPLQFIVRAYNLDDTFPHKLWIGFSVIRPKYTQGIIEFLDFLTGGGGA